jgi:hypothetical protein
MNVQWRQSRIVTDIIRSIIESVGLVIAGVWVLFTFGLQSCPAREKQFDSQEKLTWTDGPTPDTCIANYYVLLKNLSSRKLWIARTNVDIFRVSPVAPTESKPTFVDAEVFRPKRAQDYLFHESLDPVTGPFVDYYAPNGADDTTFHWIFKRPTLPEWVAIEVKFYEKGESKTIWEVSQVSEVCPPSDLTKQTHSTGVRQATGSDPDVPFL